MSLASLGGAAVTKLRVMAPRWGLWWLDINLAGEVNLSGVVTTTLADISLTGAVWAGGAADGRSAYRIVGGRGGWGKSLPKRAYLDDSGIKTSTIMGDAAKEAGEQIEGLPSTRQGPHWARFDQAPASAIMHQLAPKAWRVGFDGVTRLGAYPASTFTGDAARVRREPGSQVIELVTDKLAQLVPGVSVDGSLPATDVEYNLDKDRLSVSVYSGRRATGARVDALERTILALFPALKYAGAWEFRVVTQSGDRLNLQPARAASGLPDLQRVPVRPGMAGLKAQVALGELVLVTFADCDPSRPQVVSHDATDAPGWMPFSLELGGPGARGLARIGDTVQAGPYAGVITSASARIKGAD